MTQAAARAHALPDEDERTRQRRHLAARERRTVTITGRPDRPPARLVEVERRRPPRRPVERLGSRPDRLAMWAVAMALFLVLVTLTSPGG